MVQPFESLALVTLDYSSLGVREIEPTIRDYAIQHGSEPFDLQNGPILRFALLHTGPKEDFLFFAIHHIAFDDWSRYVFVQEMLQLYEAYQTRQEPELVSLPVQYTDYALWQKEWINGETRTAFVRHWKSLLSGELPILALSTDHPRQIKQTYHGSRHLFKLSPSFSERIKEFCRDEHLTPAFVLMAAYALFLMRYTGQDDIIIGHPFANRPRPEQTNLIGYFINTLPIRLNLGSNPSVRELLTQVRTVMLDASAWKALPFDTLVAELAPQRELGRTPIYQAIINILNVPKRQRSIPGLEIDLFLHEQILVDFDISMELFNHSDYFEAALYYNTDLFDESTILRMANHYQNILQEMLHKPDSSVSEQEMLSAAERRQILVDWNNTYTQYPNKSCLHELFETQVMRTPEAIAVTFENERFTYRELNARANQLANHLRRLGVAPETMVGLYIDRSMQAITGILGILKAGGVNLPISTNLPHERLAFILADAQPLVVLTIHELREKLPGNATHVVCLDSEWDEIAREPEGNLGSIAKPDNLAYVIYTSGSTGQPKGVMLPHRSLVNNLHYFQTTYQIHGTDRVLQHMSLNFDFAIQEIFIALLSGACLVLANQQKQLDAGYLAQLIEIQGITIAGFIPSHLETFLETQRNKANNSLRQVFCGGEELSSMLQKLFFEKYSAKLYNTYGPTEATIDVAHWMCKRGDTSDIVPIGRPIGNIQLYVLDRWLQPVPIGVPGELYIGGDGLARGYLNKNELTAEKFIPDPFSHDSTNKLYKTGDLVRYLPDGAIVFMGRLDNQVKLRGFRIELGEIETTIDQHPDISQSLVVAREDRKGNKRLIAYIVLAGAMVLDVDKLRVFLRDKLPAYMIPSTFVQIDALPLTTNGKIDRKVLPVPEATGIEEFLPAQNELQAQIIQIWEDLLQVSRIGLDDGFFDLGGNSLMAIRFVATLERESNLHLPVIELFRSSTVRQLAQVIQQRQTETPLWTPLVEIQPGGPRRPLFFFYGLTESINLARALGPDWPIYELEIPGLEAGLNTDMTVEQMATRYLEVIKSVQPFGPYRLLGYCFGGLLAYELACRLELQGERVSLMVEIDGVAKNNVKHSILYWFANLIENIPYLIKNPNRITWLLFFVEHSLFLGKEQLHKKSPNSFFRLKRIYAKAQFLRKNIQKMSIPFNTSGQTRADGSAKVHTLDTEVANKVNERQEHMIIRQIQNNYRPQPYSGHVTVFSAKWKESPNMFFLPADPTLGWRKLAQGGVEVHSFKGDHHSVLKQPYLTAVAATLKKILQRLDTEDRMQP
jgi:amino acid adenylation domain-containing protein